MLEYRLYSNDGAGGPIDYSTVVATVSVLTWDTPPLALTSDNAFAVRAHDTVTDIEEQNLDARVRIVVDGAGADVTGLPNAPTGLAATAKVGAARVSWVYNAGGQGGKPTGFHVYLGSPTVSYSGPALTVPYTAGRPTFFGNLTGLADGDYQVAVRAYNAVGEEVNAIVVDFTVDGTGPDPVDELTIVPVP